MASPEILDFETLLAPISADQPSGVELKSDTSLSGFYYAVKDAREAARTAEREALRQALAGDDEEETATAAPPDWQRVHDLAIDVIAHQSKDLWIAAWLIEALVRRYGFAGLRDGFRLTRELAERYWQAIHPQPDEDGYVTTVAQLAGLNGEDSDGVLLPPLHAVPVTQSSTYGSLTSADYRKALALEGAAEARRAEAIEQGDVTLQLFERAARETPPEFYRTLLDDLDGCCDEFDRLTQVFESRCGENVDGYSAAPPSSNIRNALTDCRDLVRNLAAPVLGNAATAVAATASDDEPSEAAQQAGQAIDTIENREQALRTLLKVADFFRHSEPHSPVSYALEQAVRWGHMPLPELLTELIPDESARSAMFRLTGIPPRNNTESE